MSFLARLFPDRRVKATKAQARRLGVPVGAELTLKNIRCIGQCGPVAKDAYYNGKRVGGVELEEGQR